MDSLYSGYYCYVVKPGVFAGAAVLSLVCIALGILYYLTLTSRKSQDGQWSGSPGIPTQCGIAMGQPHIPPTTQGLVFVHEDTYIRQHFT
ncbi:hypothetical protein Nepgr_020950 [Nepenthes gracilis]|uniref:Uncharacterized protein n=1 Tax=Nepenthes gracilis TaxID=150966 RepID=A0AAD3XWL3_NEPGR|nr:hypothetical protein Nepgr_020950 [Nepenthes gracilis]